MSEGRCFKCDDRGHLARDCPMPRQGSSIREMIVEEVDEGVSLNQGKRVASEKVASEVEIETVNISACNIEDNLLTMVRLWLIVL